MHKSFLLKAVFLIILLFVVSAVIVVLTRLDFSSNAVTGVRNQTFFEQFVIAGGPIVWFVLLPMSLVTVYLAAEHGLTIRRNRLLPNSIGTSIAQMSRQSGSERLEEKLAGKNDLLSIAVAKAITNAKDDWFRMRSILAESLQDQASQLLRKIEWVNLIGNVSPMVGLFGTVYGMIKLFNTIVIAGGQPQPAQLADGISIALVTTFWGLFIAIPALAIYGIFRNRIETLISDAVVEAESIMPEIRKHLKEHRHNVTG